MHELKYRHYNTYMGQSDPGELGLLRLVSLKIYIFNIYIYIYYIVKIVKIGLSRNPTFFREIVKALKCPGISRNL